MEDIQTVCATTHSVNTLCIITVHIPFLKICKTSEAAHNICPVQELVSCWCLFSCYVTVYIIYVAESRASTCGLFFGPYNLSLASLAAFTSRLRLLLQSNKTRADLLIYWSQ